VAVEVELWMHPTCFAAATALRANRDSAEAAATTRTIALLDAAVASLRESGDILSTLAALRPRPLATVEFLGSTLTGWPTTTDGQAIQQSCVSGRLCLYQMGRVRSVAGILDCGEEIFVVWLGAVLTAQTRADGFENDTDAALANQQLWNKLGLLVDLTWLESE
jgi:hypothetical protein